VKFGIFTLTGREQRVVIIIVMILVAAAVFSRWRNPRNRATSPPETPISATPSPIQKSDNDNEAADPSEP
jgi:hypothetical protein